MDGKFLTDETKDSLVKVLDELTNVGLFEPLEKAAYRIVLNQVDKYADKVVPDYLDDKINAACQLALEKNYVEAAGICGEIIDELVDLEKVDDTTERLIFVDGTKFIVRQIILLCEKNK